MIHSINRNAVGAFGSGLPIYKALEYQERNGALGYKYAPRGYWGVPSNKLPTTQFTTKTEIVAFDLIRTNGDQDEAPQPLPLSFIETVNLTSGDIVNYITDAVRNMINSGVYYMRFETSTGLLYYSECFHAGAVCSASYSLTYIVQQVNVDLTVDVQFTFGATGGAANLNILSGNYSPGVFTVTNIPTGATAIQIDIEVTECGTFTQGLIFNNDAGATFSLTKTY